MAKAWFTTLPRALSVPDDDRNFMWWKWLLTLFTLVVLVEFESLESGTSGDELMRELGFMIGVIIAPTLAVDLLVSVLRIT